MKKLFIKTVVQIVVIRVATKVGTWIVKKVEDRLSKPKTVDVKFVDE